MKHDRLDEPATAHVYASLLQRSGRSLSFLVKRRADNPALAESIRQAVAAVDVDLPVFAVAPLNETLELGKTQAERWLDKYNGEWAGDLTRIFGAAEM